MKNIVFVCTGNTCRSPMAEGIMKKLLKQKVISDINVSSAGISAFTGDDVSTDAVVAVKKFDVDIAEHRARRINEFILDNTDIFVCMTESHKIALINLGVDTSKIYCLEVNDPYMMGSEVYELCATDIKNKLEILFEELVK